MTVPALHALPGVCIVPATVPFLPFFLSSVLPLPTAASGIAGPWWPLLGSSAQAESGSPGKFLLPLPPSPLHWIPLP